jgi:hypothetical protein
MGVLPEFSKTLSAYTRKKGLFLARKPHRALDHALGGQHRPRQKDVRQTRTKAECIEGGTIGSAPG